MTKLKLGIYLHSRRSHGKLWFVINFIFAVNFSLLSKKCTQKPEFPLSKPETAEIRWPLGSSAITFYVFYSRTVLVWIFLCTTIRFNPFCWDFISLQRKKDILMKKDIFIKPHKSESDFKHFFGFGFNIQNEAFSMYFNEWRHQQQNFI